MISPLQMCDRIRRLQLNFKLRSQNQSI